MSVTSVWTPPPDHYDPLPVEATLDDPSRRITPEQRAHERAALNARYDAEEAADRAELARLQKRVAHWDAYRARLAEVEGTS